MTAPRQEIQRVYLAAHRTNGDWLVADLEAFVEDCKRSGIPGETRLHRAQDELAFGHGFGHFYAERILPLETSQINQE